MICTSIQHKTYEQILAALDDPFVEMAEIRLDLCDLTNDEVQELFSTCTKPLVATCRAELDWEKAQRQLTIAAEAGARYIDIDISAPVSMSQYFQKLCRSTGTRLIRSFHDFEKTPSVEYLTQVVSRCFRYGADVAKIVTTAKCEEDCATVESLYMTKLKHPGSLVAFAMGEIGQKTRIECLRNGAPFSYGAFDEVVAPGQIGLEEMHEHVYGDFLGIFRDDFTVPASKSFAQRAIIAAALAEGTSRLCHYTPCEDSESAISVAKALGAKVTKRTSKSGTTLTINGIGPLAEKLEIDTLNVGESGLLTRLMIPILSQIAQTPVRIEGRGTLPTRPLNGAADIMAAFGILLRNEAPHNGREIFVPLTIKGSMIAGTADIPGKGGSQLISGLLMTLPLCEKASKVYVGEPKSIPYMFITIDVLRKFGIEVGAQLEGDADMLQQQDWSYCTGINFSIRGGQRYKAAQIDLEGDWSAAANFLVAGALYGGVEMSGLDTSSLQADISILDVLVEAGAAVSYDDETVNVKKSPLNAFDFDLSQAPDIFPIVSVLAAFCPGVSTIAGVGRLRSKESDRASAIVEMLSGMGVEASIEGDILSIKGETLVSRLLSGHLLKGGNFTSRHDHRMAMALKVASIAAESPVVIDDQACVAKSFPDFFEQFS